MRIAMFSLGPLFRTACTVARSATWRRWCGTWPPVATKSRSSAPAATNNNTPFRLADAATVHPVLEFRQTFPEPYGVPPYKLANIIEILASAAESHDRFYLNDADLMYDFVYDGLPAVVSFRTSATPRHWPAHCRSGVTSSCSTPATRVAV